MIRTLLLLALAALPLASCSSVDAEYGPLSGTARPLGDLDIEMKDGVVRFDDSDFAVYQLTLVNHDDDEAWVEWRARWFDDHGFEVNDTTRLWKSVNIQGGSWVPLRSVAPSVKGVRCEIEVREPNPLH